jgi:hypothetical protein
MERVRGQRLADWGLIIVQTRLRHMACLSLVEIAVEENVWN